MPNCHLKAASLASEWVTPILSSVMQQFINRRNDKPLPTILSQQFMDGFSSTLNCMNHWSS
jgi:hypothetical protein